MSREKTNKEIIENKAIAVIRIKNSDKLLNTVQSIFECGIKGIEITMTVPNAIEVIQELSQSFGDKILLGAGSILNIADAVNAIKAGANYIVSPVLKKELIEEVHKHDASAIPGTFTPTEAQQAHEAGADFIKVFPADILGMAYFKGVLAPLPHLKLIPTGGVTLTNAGDWIKSGAAAVGVGSALLDKKAIEENNFDIIKNNALMLMQSIKEE